jgi:hypothetical protein
MAEEPIIQVTDPKASGYEGYAIDRTFRSIFGYVGKRALLTLEIDSLHTQAENLKAAFALMQKHHKVEEIAKKATKDRTPHEKTLQVLNIFINDLDPLIKRIEAYGETLNVSLTTTIKLQIPQTQTIKQGRQETNEISKNVEVFAKEVQKLNAALKKACDTTILYDVSTGLLQGFPNAYYLFILLGPLDVGVTIALALSATGVIGVPLSLLISLAEIWFSISAIFPIIHGISALIKNTANPIDFKVEQLEALSKETCAMDDKFSTAFPDASKQDENTNYGIPYVSFFQPDVTEPRKGFLKPNSVTRIQEYFSPTASLV